MIGVLRRWRVGGLIALSGLLGGLLLWRLFGTGDQYLTGEVAGSPILALPVAGEWESVDSPGHDRFAFDLMRRCEDATREGSTLAHLAGTLSVEDVYAWSEPVYAPASGVVSAAADGEPDRRQLSLLPDLFGILAPAEPDPEDLRPMLGNHVVITADEEFSVVLAHLREGSLQVEPGDRVEDGDQVGEVGNSGRSLEPHLHLQVMDGGDVLAAQIIPFRLADYERWRGEAWDELRLGVLGKDERVRSIGGSGC